MFLLKERSVDKYVGYIGIHYILSESPIWLTALILYAITLGAINELRDCLEGIPYQVARSAQYGDAGLIIVILIASTILHRETAIVFPDWLNQWVMSANAQKIILMGCVALGVVICFLTLKSRSGQVADIYHDVFVGPMILFFAFTLLPVIIFGGNSTEKVATALLIAFWLIMVVTDIKGERMDQRTWLQHHGVRFIKKL